MKNIFILLSVAAIMASCGGSGSSDKQTELDRLLKEQAKINEQILKLKDELRKETGDMSGIKLVVASVPTPQVFRHYVEVQAKVDGDESVAVSPRTQGVVSNILVKTGDNVSKGQVLATLDDIVVRQSLAEVQTQYDFAKNIYEKQKNLWDQKIGSEVQYLTAKNNKESLEKRMATMNEQLDLTRIKSPVNGTVDYAPLKVGQTVAPGVQAFSVVNLTSMKVKGEVGETYSGKIKKGDDVILYFPDLKKEIASKVGYASKTINILNRTFNVEVPLSREEGATLSPNMVVVMKISDYYSEKALVVPVDMLQRSGEGNYVMIAAQRDGKLIAVRKMVQTGRIYNGMAEVLSGLTETDNLITAGYRDLNDGQEIRTK